MGVLLNGTKDSSPLPEIGSQWIRTPIDEQDPFEERDSIIYTVVDVSNNGDGYVKYSYQYRGYTRYGSTDKRTFYVCHDPIKPEEK